LLPLLDEVLGVVDVPVIAAGGIGSGRGVAAVLSAGADAARVGTRFIAASETGAHPVYVDALIAATAVDTVLTTAFGDGWPDAPHRVLQSSVEAGTKLGASQSWSPEWPTSTYAGVAEARPLYAGQSVGSVHSHQTAADIVAELVGGAERLLSTDRFGSSAS
jgi:NAD(P)H-dependent flavin oxidoreductase YrpB (nitropropane dioxygenase family)